VTRGSRTAGEGVIFRRDASGTRRDLRRAMTRSSFILLAAALAASGQSMTYTPLNEPPRRLAPRSPASVEVYSAKRPPRTGVEIGLIEIEHDSPMSAETPDVVVKLRTRAAQIGCDAVLLSDRLHDHRAACFVYTDAAATRPVEGEGFPL
jgi:hypothetical protein